MAITPLPSRLWGSAANRSPPGERCQGTSGRRVTALLVSPTGASYLFDPCEPTEMVPAAGSWRFWPWWSASRLRWSLRSAATSPRSARRAAYQSFDGLAQLKSAPGFLLRGGIWLPLNFSVEAEATFATPKAKARRHGTSYRALFLSLLYNIPVGRSNWFYLKAGGGSNSYAGNRYDECPTTGGDVIRREHGVRQSGVLAGGARVRLGLTPTLLARGEAVFPVTSRARTATVARPQTLTNFGSTSA